MGKVHVSAIVIGRGTVHCATVNIGVLGKDELIVCKCLKAWFESLSVFILKCFPVSEAFGIDVYRGLIDSGQNICTKLECLLCQHRHISIINKG